MQSVVTSNGVIAHMFDPIEGNDRVHFMLSTSGLTEELYRFDQSNGRLYLW